MSKRVAERYVLPRKPAEDNMLQLHSLEKLYERSNAIDFGFFGGPKSYYELEHYLIYGPHLSLENIFAVNEVEPLIANLALETSEEFLIKHFGAVTPSSFKSRPTLYEQLHNSLNLVIQRHMFELEAATVSALILDQMHSWRREWTVYVLFLLDGTESEWETGFELFDSYARELKGVLSLL